MNFKASKVYVVVIILLIILLLCVPEVVVTPSPVAIEVMPSTPEICVEAPNVEVTICDTYEQRYTEELVNIVMSHKEYPWQVCNITSTYIDKGLWIVTVEFKDWDRKYVFDEEGA